MATMTADEVISFLENNEKVKIVLNVQNRPNGIRTAYGTLSNTVIANTSPYQQKEIITKDDGDKKTKISIWDLQRNNWDRFSLENLTSIEVVSEFPEKPESFATPPPTANNANSAPSPT